MTETGHRVAVVTGGSRGIGRAAVSRLARDGVAVVVGYGVAPGPTATDLFLDGKSEELVARLTAEPPMERLGTPEDIAELVAFLAGPAGHWVDGQVIRANGGLV